MTAPVPRLELVDIDKRYGAVLANDRVSLRVMPGEIHAVLGENGAGKSTLMKVIYGALRPDTGMLRWNGTPVSMASPAEARALGIAMVFQHFQLFESMTVADNVWLGLDRAAFGPASRATRAAVVARIEAAARRHGLEVEPARPVHTLSVGERQRVEILRALLAEPSLLILDEPTSVLTPLAVQQLFATLRRLAAGGCSILYISHKLDEIRALCQRCTVLRHGRVTGTVEPAHESHASLSRLMIGAEPPPLQHTERAAGAALLEVRALSLPAVGPFGSALVDLDFVVRAGEVVGIAGVSGNGQRELAAVLGGEDLRPAAASIRLAGTPVGRVPPGPRRALGLHAVPEQRIGHAAVGSLSLAANTLLTRTEAVTRGGWIRARQTRALAQKIIARFQVKASGPDALAAGLSGGNLQKFIVGRELDAAPRVLVVAQPTWGVDVGSAALIRAALLALRDGGAAVLVFSEDVDELFEVCDRLHVIARGRLSPSVASADASPALIGEWMSGLWPADGPAQRPAEPHAPAFDAPAGAPHHAPA